MQTGWIRLYRSIQEHDMWLSEPFTRAQAWIDLLLLANYDYSYFYLREHRVDVMRGQVGISVRQLASRWRWSRTKANRFINDLENEQQVKIHKSHSISIITIVNYDNYQQKEPLVVPQKSHRKATIKNNKESKENNNFVNLFSETENEIDEKRDDESLEIFNSQTQKQRIDYKAEKETFDKFRLAYKKIGGNCRGLDVEFDNFKKHSDWQKVNANLIDCLRNQYKAREQNRANGHFVPVLQHLKTYINQRSWETEIAIMPKKTNPQQQQTVNKPQFSISKKYL